MIHDHGAIITQNFDPSIGTMLGKLEVAPTPAAQWTWEHFMKNPDLYEFALGYTEDPKTKKKELMEISLVIKRGHSEQTSNRKSTL